MFIQYVKDMKSWILIFAASPVLTDALIWIDNGLAMRLSSLVYLNMRLIAIFMLFLIWRYKKETHFMRELLRISEDPSRDWQEGLPEPLFTRDQTTNDLLRQVANDHLKK